MRQKDAHTRTDTFRQQNKAAVSRVGKDFIISRRIRSLITSRRIMPFPLFAESKSTGKGRRKISPPPQIHLLRSEKRTPGRRKKAQKTPA